MHTVSIAEAKAHLSQILNQVIAGEEVIVTRRGHPIARIEAVNKHLKPIPNLEAFRTGFPKLEISSQKILRRLRDEEF